MLKLPLQKEVSQDETSTAVPSALTGKSNLYYICEEKGSITLCSLDK